VLHAGRTSFEPKTTVFFLEGGLNDRSVPTEQFVADMQGMIQKLYAAGGRRLRVADLPESVTAYANVARRLNRAIPILPGVMRVANKTSKSRVTEWGHFFDVVFANDAQYGFTDPTHQCAGRAPFGKDVTVCATPKSHFFFHKNHPSAAVAKIVGDRMCEEWTVGTR
jgi:phospholipase/lecithinase/hemolysin